MKWRAYQNGIEFLGELGAGERAILGYSFPHIKNSRRGAGMNRVFGWAQGGVFLSWMIAGNVM
jgi:hypothetical protein